MILFKNVTYKIKGKTILNNISFSINNNEKVLLVGNSGSGKTTIFNLLLKNVKLTSGQIIYNDKNIYKLSYKELLSYRQKEIIIISQNDDLFDNLTVINNLTLFYYYQDVIDILKKSNLYYLKDRYVNSLSGGERQKIAIIKACLASCNVLLCDEITSSLDEDSASKIIEFILLLFKNKTIIFISHNIEIFKENVDRIIEIDNHTIKSNTIINNINCKKIKSDEKKKKSLFKVSLLQGIKKISFSSFIVILMTITTFYMSLSFNDIFNYFAINSYKNYIDYDVLLINDNNDFIVDKDNNIYPSISNYLSSSNLYVNDKLIKNVTYLPFNSKDNNLIIINKMFIKRNNINKIDKLTIINENVYEVFDNIKISDENNMFETPCIYYDIKYFNKYYNESIDNNLYIINYDFKIDDDRFTNNPLYDEKKEDKPYLSNNALYDYLTYKLVFDAISMIVDYFFMSIFFFTLILSILLNISLIIKDSKQIAIYISRGYSDFQILLFYLFPLLIYFTLLFPLLFIFKLSFALAFIIQILSLIISYYFIKKKSLNDLLKSEILT